MTLDEAIKHAEEVAEENEKFCYKKGGKGGYFNEDTDWDNAKCAAEHRQLAEWLKDYQRLLEQESVFDKIRAEIEQITNTMGVSYNQYVSKIDALQIIDKYKAESGVEE